MDRGQGVGDFCSKEMFSCDGLTQIAREWEKKGDPCSFVKSTRSKIMKSIDEQIARNKLDYKHISQKEIHPARIRGFGSCIPECAIMACSGTDDLGCASKSSLEKSAPNL